MNPTAPAQRLARQITKVVGPCYQDDSRLTDVAMLIDAAIQEATKELREQIGNPPEDSHPDEAKPRAKTWHLERQNWKQENAQLRFEIFNLSLAAKNFESEAVQDRDQLRADLAALRTVAAEMAGALEDFYQNPKRSSMGASHPHLAHYISFPEETWSNGKTALASYARLQKEKTP